MCITAWRTFFLSTLSLLLSLRVHAQYQIKAIANLPYATVATKALLLDLYLPQGVTAKTPLVLWIHGGAWSTTTNITKNNIGHITSVLVPKGIAVASLNYRLSEEAKWPAQIQDCKGAVRWLRANADLYNLDGQIGAWGESAGAHLAALLGTAGGVGFYTSGAYTADLEGDIGGNLTFSSRVQGVVDYFGPTDFFRSSIGKVNFGWDVTNADFPPNMLIDGLVLQNPDKCKSASSLTFVDPKDPPFLIFHGTADNQVLQEQSKYLDSALRQNGVPCSLTTFEGLGHGGSAFWSATITKQIYDFFVKTLKATGIGIQKDFRNAKISSGPRFLFDPASNQGLFYFNQTRWDAHGHRETLGPEKGF